MEDPDNKPLYYVGMGASAGGLEALGAFFDHMPPDSDMAFIVVQHLSPDYKSLMVELLSKRTSMTVRHTEEQMPVEANIVYLIPPGKSLSIFHGRLMLSESDCSGKLKLPIDVFLRSLADDQGEKAVGVILSGTGSDGVRGLRAVKEAGGMIMVQSPDTAKFDGMPQAAISTGLADFILPPEEMPRKLLSLPRHPSSSPSAHPQSLLSDEDGMSRLFALLRESTRVDFSFYKPSTVVRRIERRMTVNQVSELRDYANLLEDQPHEVKALYRELLIGVTSFFRDPRVFEELKEKYLPSLFEDHSPREVRFWIAGCSTGEEAYTLAIVASECMDRLGKRPPLKVFATDLDRDAVVRAGAGTYPESIAADVPPKILARYFHRRNDHYQVDRSVREMVVFARHNLLTDPPFTNIDLVSCRNLLIYLQPVLQRKVLELVNFSLNPRGLLLLGTSETTGEMADHFHPLHHKFKIYRSSGKRRHPNESFVLRAPANANGSPPPRLSVATGRKTSFHEEEQLLDRFLQGLAGDCFSLAVLVDERMEVLHIAGDPEGYLKLPAGKQSRDVTKMTSRELAIPLATGLQKVFNTGEGLCYNDIPLRRRGEPGSVTMRIKSLGKTRGKEPLAAVLFQESAPASLQAEAGESYDVHREAEQRIQDLENELQFMRENLQATIEELETTNEELQATNEELLASNEELQSTNEELQSVNEELYTVNTEHQTKIIELTELNNDLDNLLASVRIATLFLDENREVRKFTPETARIFRISPKDAGRSLHNLAHNIEDADPLEIVEEVERTGMVREKEVRTTDGAWWLMRVLPYDVGSEIFSGTVLTFTDIGAFKRARAEISARDARLSSLFRASPVGVGLVVERVLQEVNERMLRMLGYSREELLGRSARILYPSDEEFESVGRGKYAQIRSKGLGTVETWWKRKDGTTFPVLLSSAPLDPLDLSQGVTFTALDLSEVKGVEEKCRLNEARLKSLYNIIHYPARSVQDLLDYTLEEAIRLTGSRVGYIYHYDEERKELRLNSWSQDVMKECDIADSGTVHRLDATGIWGEAVRRRQPLLINDFQAPDPSKKGYPKGHVELRRFLTVPVFMDESIVAVAGVGNKETDYDEADVRQTSLLMESVWTIVERKQTEERYRMVADFTYDWEYWSAPDGKLLYVSPSCRRITGYTAQEFLADSDLMERIVHPEDLPALERHKFNVYHDEEGPEVHEADFRIVRRDGEERWIGHVCRRVHGADGTFLGLRGSNRDMTERKS